jgi:hypothetical protein
MDIDISISLGRQELLVGEDTPATITATNVSSAPVSLPDLVNADDLPKLRLVEKAGKRVVIMGPTDRESQATHEFIPPTPVVPVHIAPKAHVQRPVSLLKWFGPIAPGRYEVSALLDYNAIHAASQPVAFSVAPLHLECTWRVGSHSGYTPFRYTLWCSLASHGFALIFTSYTFDEEGHPQLIESYRVADLEYSIQPVASVTANKQPYPAQWITWLHDGKLASVYLKQSKIAMPLRMHSLDGPAGARIIGPVLLDLTGNDGTRPARGIVALWQASKIVFRTLEADSSLKEAASVDVKPGEFAWGQAVALSTGERRVYLAIGRNGGTDIACVRMGDRSATQLAHLPGRLVGAGVSLNQQDVIHGGAVVREGDSFSVHTWQADVAGTTRMGTPTNVARRGTAAYDRALVVPSPAGKLCILGHAANQWTQLGAAGTLPQAVVEKYGAPIDAFWLNETQVFAAMAGSQTGITYQPIR